MKSSIFSKWYVSLLCLLVFSSFNYNVLAQCCSAGGGSPIAGGLSQGVLEAKQFEVGVNYQYLYSDVFLKGSEKANDFLDSYSYQYLYSHIAFGLSSKLTASLEAGYYINKIQDGLGEALYEESSGMSDLIFFPRYNFLSQSGEKGKWDFTAGVGIKFSIGSYDDSIEVNHSFAQYTVRKAPSVQLSTGANDAMFYLFGMRTFNKSKFKVFANGIYIIKGYNPLGEKNGNYFSGSLFVARPLVKNIGATLQMKYELIDPMKVNKYFSEMGYYSTYDYTSTGSEKISVGPQLNYSNGKSTLFVSADVPLYQHVNKTQIASKYLVTLGFSHRFFL
ncbi:MAG TPA: hypothetical protein PKH65_09140 [Bacteroidia bacterium]|nr:hypothetical protein [Bacteroidia bacterium]HNT80831.1 hypothetical protein [Bacteroidia bacterium]